MKNLIDTTAVTNLRLNVATPKQKSRVTVTTKYSVLNNDDIPNFLSQFIFKYLYLTFTEHALQLTHNPTGSASL
jgi:hypothetical protein